MAGDAHDHQGSCPDDDAGVARAEEKGKDEERYDQQHAPDGNITEQRDDSDCQGDAREGGKGETVQHDCACRRDAFSAPESEEHGPVMADHAAKPGQQ